MQKHSIKIYGTFAVAMLALTACNQKDTTAKKSEQPASATQPQVERAEVLPYLEIKEQQAKYGVPFCEKKNCIDIDLQTLTTQEAWLNQWITQAQTNMIQDQIGLKQKMTLQQAIDAYIKKSDIWVEESSSHKPYELQITTRIAAQRNQYLLLQLALNSTQEEMAVKDRHYFFVADRKQKKGIRVLEIIQPQQQEILNEWVQKAYQKWLEEQPDEARKSAPKKLYWGQADWFFDGEGVGLHYRTHEIVEKGEQLDIYLTKAQTKQILKPDIYQQMF